MPNVLKEIAKCKHPNSRKTLALTKLIKKSSTRKKSKVVQYMKQNVIAEKVAWFRDNLLPDVSVYTAEQTEEIINKYLLRFDEELEQITIKHSVGERKNRQHASREDMINITKKRELEEFITCGIEIPDILNPKYLEVLRKWNGELRFLQNIKLRRVSKKYLQHQKSSKSTKCTNNNKPDTAPLSKKDKDTLMDVD
ncbi:uncharacterized protein CBL_04635 [Carabus blaptoides fortunei]